MGKRTTQERAARARLVQATEAFVEVCRAAARYDQVAREHIEAVAREYLEAWEAVERDGGLPLRRARGGGDAGS